MCWKLVGSGTFEGTAADGMLLVWDSRGAIVLLEDAIHLHWIEVEPAAASASDRTP
jgi:hypothetical protein